MKNCTKVTGGHTWMLVTLECLHAPKKVTSERWLCIICNVWGCGDPSCKCKKFNMVECLLFIGGGRKPCLNVLLQKYYHTWMLVWILVPILNHQVVVEIHPTLRHALKHSAMGLTTTNNQHSGAVTFCANT